MTTTAPRLSAFTPISRVRCRGVVHALLGLSLAFVSAIPMRGAAAAPQAEYSIKGAYLFNFTRFIDWPPQAYPSETAPFVIGLLEPDADAAAAIQETFRGKTMPSGRLIEVRVLPDLGPAALTCQLLFVSRDSPVDVAAVRSVVGDRAILIVGETSGAAQRGGAINFVVSGDSVRIEINLQRAQRAGLKLSGRLANVARLVHDSETD
jgi:hypothetical protein